MAIPQDLTIRLSQKRILLFKTTSVMHQYYYEYLDFVGFEVYDTHQIEEALQILETIAIDILICDVENEEGQKNLQVIQSSFTQDESVSIIALSRQSYLSNQLLRKNVYSYPLATDINHFSDGNFKKLLVLIRSIIQKMKYILILNDSYHDQVICEQSLMRRNYHLHTTCNGHIAFNTLMNQSNFRVDLLVLDLCNRYYSGFMLLSQLAQAKHHMPVFVVTTIEVNADQILQRTGFQIHSILNKQEASQLPQLIAQNFGMTE